MSSLIIKFVFQDSEICRQFDFQEQTFLIAMDTLSALLRNCKQSLTETAKQMTEQVTIHTLILVPLHLGHGCIIRTQMSKRFGYNEYCL